MAVDFIKNKATLAAIAGFFNPKNHRIHQQQEHNAMNTNHIPQAPVTRAREANSASNDLMDLAMNPANTLPLQSSATKRDIVIEAADTSTPRRH